MAPTKLNKQIMDIEYKPDKTMKKFTLAITTAAAAVLLLLSASPRAYSQGPDGTLLFAQKDGQDLFLDYYTAKGEKVDKDGNAKPSIIFVFGGGFKMGARNEKSYFPYFTDLAEHGYNVFSIDYRLGLKDATTVGVKQVKEIQHAVLMAVEDLFSATAFLLDNAEQLGVQADNIVIAGSSAGAMTSLQADWEICNHSDIVKNSPLPEGFRYAGVMSFSGAVFSDKGHVSYPETPAPTLFLHGTEDKIVSYQGISFMNWRLSSSKRLVKEFSKMGYNYNFLKFPTFGHDIASSMLYTLPEQYRFLEENVMKGNKRIVESSILDPAIPKWDQNWDVKDVYKPAEQ